MVTTTDVDLTPRFVRLFAEAGLIAEGDMERYGEKYRKNKSLVDVLKQDVSLESFRDLLFAEIALPKRNRQAGPLLAEQLTVTTALRGDELRAILQAVQPPPDALIERLLEAEVADAAKLRAGLKKAQELGENVYDWLIRHDLLNGELVQHFLRAATNPLRRRCSLILALSVLRHNQLISDKAFDQLSKKAYGEAIEKAVEAVKSTLRLGSAELLEKIESGLYLPEIAPEEITPEPSLLEMFPVGLVRRQIFLPVRRDAHRIVLAIADPLNVDLAVLIRWITGKWMLALFAPSGTIIQRINEFYAAAETVAPAHRPIPAAGRVKTAGKQGEKRPKTRPGAKAAPEAALDGALGEVRAPVVAPALRQAGEAPVDSLSAVQLVSSLIESAIELRGTDIHLEPTREEMTVRFRIDGLLKKIMSLPQHLVGPVVSRIKVLANMDVTERRRPQDGHMMLDLTDRHFDFRIATMPTVFGEKVAVRILDSSRVMMGLDELGMNDRQLKLMRRMIHRPFGIILVTGPTGSGKTSTLYAGLNELNSEERHLVTIEDPVEYQIDGVNQIQVDLHIGLTFSEGLRAILRQDPNIIMVGEIRDADTARTAIRAAMTGHLVFSTLHTNTALAAIQALEQLGATPFMIGSAITGLVAQRLVRVLCPRCKKGVAMTKALAAQLGLKQATKKVYEPKGCDQCFDLGYRGRVGIFEVVEMTERLREAVLNGQSPETLRKIADGDGRQSIAASGVEKVLAGVTSPEEVIQKVILDV